LSWPILPRPRFLVEIGYEQVLPPLFQQVWIPGVVASELRRERTPELVRRWAERLPPMGPNP